MTDTILPPSPSAGTVRSLLRGRAATAGERAAHRRARCLNLLGLCTPVANLGMTVAAPRDLRWFGVGAGATLLAVTAWGWFTGNPWAFALGATAHASLVAAGLVHPRLPEAVGRAWIGLGAAMGRVVSIPLFAVLYFVVVTPTALLVRLFVGDPLRRRAPPAGSYWTDRTTSRAPDFERQF